LTAKSEREDMRKGMNLGADDYLTKPFDDLELLDAIEIRLKKSDIVREEFKKNVEGLDEFINQAKGLKELDNLLSNEKRINNIPKKHTIFSEGSYPNFLYFLNKGKIKTFKTDNQGNEFITGLYKNGDFIGYTDLLENSNYTENAVALEDSEICMIKRDDFFALIYNNRDVANKFIKMLSDNVVEREERLLKLAYNSVRKRVAEALLMLQKKYQQEGAKEFTMAISRDDLSGLVGASKETVIRTLTDFKEEGLVQISGSKITIVKQDKLANMRN
jgi:CRP-like cAMP-binding protein